MLTETEFRFTINSLYNDVGLDTFATKGSEARVVMVEFDSDLIVSHLIYNTDPTEESVKVSAKCMVGANTVLIDVDAYRRVR